jgi:uncharacterized membrane protein YfcA
MLVALAQISLDCVIEISAHRSWMIAGVIALAAMLSSVAGFAFAAFAGSLMFHLVDDKLYAVQIMIVASIATQITGVLGLRRYIEWRALSPFLVGGALTILPGVYLLLHIAPQVYLQIIGVFLAVYAAYMLFRPPIVICLSGRCGVLADLVVGGLGGIMAPLAAFPGAFIPIWCGVRGWGKVRQRAVYQPYILVMQVASFCLISAATGARGLNVLLLLYALPAIAGTYVGLKVFSRLTNVQFSRILNVFIILSGLLLVVSPKQ